ncbi:MAG TPA: hypothetical protein DCY17_04840, partial [Clostridiales bacterium]|nr:hypothetical protein [Clostridiales bacterium]
IARFFADPKLRNVWLYVSEQSFFRRKLVLRANRRRDRFSERFCPYRILYQFGLFFNRPEAGQLKKNAENCEINAAIGAAACF